MDARREPRTGDGDFGAAPIPPLSGELLCSLHNAKLFAPVIARLLAQSLPTERARERASFIRLAASRSPGRSQTQAIRELHARLQMIAMTPLPAYLDGGTADGALGVVLLISSGKAPSLSTIQRALCEFNEGGF